MLTQLHPSELPPFETLSQRPTWRPIGNRHFFRLPGTEMGSAQFNHFASTINKIRCSSIDSKMRSARRFWRRPFETIASVELRVYYFTHLFGNEEEWSVGKLMRIYLYLSSVPLSSGNAVTVILRPGLLARLRFTHGPSNHRPPSDPKCVANPASLRCSRYRGAKIRPARPDAERSQPINQSALMAVSRTINLGSDC